MQVWLHLVTPFHVRLPEAKKGTLASLPRTNTEDALVFCLFFPNPLVLAPCCCCMSYGF